MNHKRNDGKCPICNKQHYGLCHKCPHQAEVAAGRWNGADFSRVPCSSCRLAVDYTVTGHGRTEPLDDAHHHIPHEEPPDHGDDRARIERFLWFIHAIVDMPAMTREILLRRIVGHTYARICDGLRTAFRRDVSVQSCHAMLRSALRRNDALREVIAAMAMTGDRGVAESSDEQTKRAEIEAR